MQFQRPDAAAVGRADDHGAGIGAAASRPYADRVAQNLVEGRVHEPGKLYLGHRAHAVDGQPDRGADDAELCQRGVAHALRAELPDEAVRCAEHAAVKAHVLAEDHDLLVALHLLAQCHVDGLDNRRDGHWNPISFICRSSRSGICSNFPTCSSMWSWYFFRRASLYCWLHRPFFWRNFSMRTTGSSSFILCASASSRYFFASSEVEWSPILYVSASMNVGPPPFLAFSSAFFMIM